MTINELLRDPKKELESAYAELRIYRAMRKVLRDAGEWAFEVDGDDVSYFLDGVLNMMDELLPDRDKCDAMPNTETVIQDDFDKSKNVSMFDGDIYPA